MELFSFFKVSVILGDSLQGEFLHEVNELGVYDVSLLEFLNLKWVSSRKKHNLLFFWHNFNDSGNNRFEIDR